MTAGREKEGRRAFRGHMVRRGQKAIAVRPVQLARRGLPVILARLVYRDRWDQPAQPGHKVQPARAVLAGNRAFRAHRVSRARSESPGHRVRPAQLGHKVRPA